MLDAASALPAGVPRTQQQLRHDDSVGQSQTRRWRCPQQVPQETTADRWWLHQCGESGVWLVRIHVCLRRPDWLIRRKAAARVNPSCVWRSQSSQVIGGGSWSRQRASVGLVDGRLSSGHWSPACKQAAQQWVTAALQCRFHVGACTLTISVHAQNVTTSQNAILRI
jgi:hypothetical protein